MKFVKKFVFHRITMLLSATLVQLIVLIGVIIRFNDYFVFFYGGSMLVSMVAVVGIINNNINPAYKLAWIVPILLFPIFGGLFYLFFGGNKTGRRAQSKMKSIEQKTKAALPPADDIIERIMQNSGTAASQSRYIQDYAYSPPYANTMTEYFPIGEKKYEKLIEELKKARKYIFLEYFIVEEGEMWDSILEILVEKAANGVDVRVMYDDAGCLFTLPFGYDKLLEEKGIKCCVFNPISPVLSPRFNNRDHRKIAVIDGHTGFTGGINLADEYINKYEKYGHWKDAAIMIKGQAVWSMTVIFLTVWDFLKGTEQNIEEFRHQGSIPDYMYADNGVVQPFADNPLDNETVGEIVYLNIINKAKEYVYITTPYLIIDYEMITALTSAAKSGVDVRIITPCHPDKWYVHAVTRSYYKVLIDGGVKIYEYTPGFIHSKMFVSDDETGIVGTINMDFRSLYLHFECGVWLYDCSCLKDMKQDFMSTLKVSRQITLEEVRNLKWYQTIGRSLLRAFAPLM